MKNSIFTQTQLIAIFTILFICLTALAAFGIPAN